MKKILLLISLCFFGFNLCQSQEWMTSFDAAKRLAVTQNKLLFVMWENANLDDIEIMMIDGNRLVIDGRDFFYDDRVNEIIWEYFVPVKIQESNYEVLFKEIEDIGDYNYISKFNDDSIKIMDANGIILNRNSYAESYELFYLFLEKYAVNTSLIQQDLRNYKKNKNFLTSYNLATKYLDFAIYTNTKTWKDYTALSNIYLDQAISFLADVNQDKKAAYSQKCELLKIKQFIMQNSARKAIRFLKKYDESEIHEINKRMYRFLFYTAYSLTKNSEEAALWRPELSTLDIKKAILITNNFK